MKIINKRIYTDRQYIELLEKRIDKAIEYIEVLYTRYIADYSDIERLEKILKGEEK